MKQNSDFTLWEIKSSFLCGADIVVNFSLVKPKRSKQLDTPSWLNQATLCQMLVYNLELIGHFGPNFALFYQTGQNGQISTKQG